MAIRNISPCSDWLLRLFWFRSYGTQSISSYSLINISKWKKVLVPNDFSPDFSVTVFNHGQGRRKSFLLRKTSYFESQIYWWVCQNHLWWLGRDLWQGTVSLSRFVTNTAVKRVRLRNCCNEQVACSQAVRIKEPYTSYKQLRKLESYGFLKRITSCNAQNRIVNQQDWPILE